MDQSQPDGQRPPCFGDLETVFPMGGQGLREVPQDCFQCPQKVECLRRAINRGEGAQKVGQEMARREEAQQGGVGGFYRRWSRLKNLSKRVKS